jgi:hypothetical protein
MIRARIEKASFSFHIFEWVAHQPWEKQAILTPYILHLLARIRHPNSLEKTARTLELADTRWSSLTPSDP